MIININGQITTSENAKISVMDRGFLYGDGVYETMLCFGEKIFFLDDHLKRLRESLKGLFFDYPQSDAYLQEELLKTVRSASYSQSVIRLLVTRGEGPLTLLPPEKLRPNCVIWVREHTPLAPHLYERGVSLGLSHIIRNDPRALNPALKTANFLNNLLALLDTHEEGVHETIMLNSEGYVAEGATSNLWIVDGEGVLRTPPLSVGILPGITRSVILDLARDHGVALNLDPFTVEDCYQSLECFITSSSRGILPVSTFNGRIIGKAGRRPLTLKLSQWYKELLEKIYKY